MFFGGVGVVGGHGFSFLYYTTSLSYVLVVCLVFGGFVEGEFWFSVCVSGSVLPVGEV